MAVYTEVIDDALAAFLADYDLGELKSYKGIAEGVENTNYLVHATAGPFILTLYEKRVDPKDLPFFLGLMEYLAARGIKCPTPVRDRQGRALRELAGRPAAIITFLEGFWIRRPRLEHCTAVGRSLAELHLAGRDFAMHRANSLSVNGWRPLFLACAGQANTIASRLEEEIAEELGQLERGWPRDLPEGVVHADLFPDNVFFLGQELSGLIDFYFACHDMLAYDVAICLNAWCFESDSSFNVTKAKALLRGYNAVRPLTPAEIDALPLLARGAALRFLLTRVYDWLNTSDEAYVKPKDPLEYLRRLRFHKSVRTAREYGFSAP